MSVIVIRNIAHVVVDLPGSFAQDFVGDSRQAFMQSCLDVVGRAGIVLSPHHHWDQTNFAVRDPAEFVVEVALSDDRRFAQVTGTH